MADFESAHKKTMGDEGGYANNPNDTGGETYKGISRNNWPKWAGWQGVDAAKNGMVKQPPYGSKEYFTWAAHLNRLLSAAPLVQKYVRDFYRVNFWTPAHLDQFADQDLATLVYNLNVNTGCRGTKWLQQALGATPDGCIGPKTLELVEVCNPVATIKVITEKAAAYYVDLSERPGQSGFLHAWLSRLPLTEEEVKAIIATA